MAEITTKKTRMLVFAASLVTVLGLTSAGLAVISEGLGPLSGKYNTQAAGKWIPAGEDVAYAWALKKRTEALIDIAAQIETKTGSSVLRNFATNLHEQALGWLSRIDGLMQQHISPPLKERKTFFKDFNAMPTLAKDLKSLTGQQFDSKVVGEFNLAVHREGQAFKLDAANLQDKDLKQLGIDQYQFAQNVPTLLQGWNK